MKMSFADTAKPAEAPETKEPTTAVARPLKEELALATQRSTPAGIEGDVGAKDIQLPRLNLIQKMSDLVNSGFLPNSFVLNKEIPLGKQLECVVVRLKKQFQQELPYGSEVTPHTCDTLAEVREAGGSTEWGADNRYSEIAHMQLLVKAPDGLSEEQLDAFPYEVDGSHWAPCMYTAAKTAYKTSAKPVITAAFGVLRQGLGNGLWTVTADLKSNPMGSWSVPQFKLTGRTKPEMLELVEALTEG